MENARWSTLNSTTVWRSSPSIGPHARNAISLETMDQLDKALDGAEGAARAGPDRRRRQGVRLRRRPQGTQRAAHRGAGRGDGLPDAVDLRPHRRLSRLRCSPRSTGTRSAAAPRSRWPPTSGSPPTTSRSASTRSRWRSCRPGAAPSGSSTLVGTSRALLLAGTGTHPGCRRGRAHRPGRSGDPAGVVRRAVAAVARSLATAPAGEVKRVMRGVPTTEAVAAFARLWVSDEHWAAADRVMKRAR